MKAVIQRVKKASVERVKDNEIVGSIDSGLFILFGVTQADTVHKASEMAEKVSKLRVMADDDDKMNRSVLDTKDKILVVSQFTLYGNTSKGNRPSFVKAAKPAIAKEIYEHFIASLQEKGIEVETGSFGDYMKISTILDGPVTILLEI